DRIRTLTLCPSHRATNRLDGILKINPAGKFRTQPKRHPRRCDSDDCKLDPSDILQDEGLDLREWMLRIRKFAGWSSLQDCVGGEHRHCRSSQRLHKRFGPPVELMIANDPRVVLEIIEQIDH